MREVTRTKMMMMMIMMMMRARKKLRQGRQILASGKHRQNLKSLQGRARRRKPDVGRFLFRTICCAD